MIFGTKIHKPLFGLLGHRYLSFIRMTKFHEKSIIFSHPGFAGITRKEKYISFVKDIISKTGYERK